jgi:hypothetical protein
MARRRRARTADWEANAWPPIFSTSRTFLEETESFVDSQRRLNPASDGITLFLQDSEDSPLSYEIEKVKDFCRGISLEALRLGVGSPGTNRSVWLDDRSCPRTNTGGVRNYGNPLTETELYQRLSVPVWNRLIVLPRKWGWLAHISDLETSMNLMPIDVSCTHNPLIHWWIGTNQASLQLHFKSKTSSHLSYWRNSKPSSSPLAERCYFETLFSSNIAWTSFPRMCSVLNVLSC